MDIEWRLVVENARYEVSNTGCVRRIRKKGGYRYLKPDRTHNDCMRVTLGEGTPHSKRRYMVHVLVASAFIGPAPVGMQRNHKDGDRTNNHVSNLEYMTPSENMKHSYDCLGRLGPQGSRHGLSKLTEDQVREIRRLRATGMELIPLGRMFGVSNSMIGYITRGDNWRHI